MSEELLEGVPARSRVLAAALKLFVDKGYFNTNIPDLSRESRCSVGSIYHNFKNKQEIAEALYNESIQAFRVELVRALAGTPVEDIETIIKNLVRFLLEFSEVNHQISRYLWLCRHQEFIDRSITQPTTIGVDALGRQLTVALRGAMKAGKIHTMPAPVLWSILFGIPLAYLRDWLDGFNRETPSTVAQSLAEACWRALKC